VPVVILIIWRLVFRLECIRSCHDFRRCLSSCEVDTLAPRLEQFLDRPVVTLLNQVAAITSGGPRRDITPQVVLSVFHKLDLCETLATFVDR